MDYNKFNNLNSAYHIQSHVLAGGIVNNDNIEEDKLHLDDGFNSLLKDMDTKLKENSYQILNERIRCDETRCILNDIPFDTDFLDPDDIYPFDVKFTEFNQVVLDDKQVLLDENGV